MDELTLRHRVIDLRANGIVGIVFVGVSAYGQARHQLPSEHSSRGDVKWCRVVGGQLSATSPALGNMLSK